MTRVVPVVVLCIVAGTVLGLVVKSIKSSARRALETRERR
jgi:hypothetical protein